MSVPLPSFGSHRVQSGKVAKSESESIKKTMKKVHGISGVGSVTPFGLLPYDTNFQQTVMRLDLRPQLEI